ncbi:MULTISPECIES: ACP S-malonyltransferase [Streptomyces]|uniref:[acyl-carrier-protein] S-malonyltransferase n=1 Tax=Streptomyces griseus subsp. griseus (strain JCM 4626 / CBS 651.72 / NBRC 13350 / KCC S-0626 / ISP 5235) TaxID=455632 RepID=B1VMY4_STRGG|nr:ACP S-malonyltransferase [Streptomyces griseus]MBW3709375.1 [acyl-carrier-protein] S-malonyltransferase [Streptomyces griseus]BAG23609.1 putative malonyl-CoA:ACP transacylase [Streptomyces griseus subsp. griseus NBRC 13350]SEE30785.1 [acyl-carrier-protein] S-malonyltransferase [Streptomyces griseus]SQA25249.1 malonyl-CoA:ACP transacylase [Streptomyces griseus]
MRCYVFPGQGTQKKGMGRSLFTRFPDLRRRADRVLGYPIEELCLENPERRLSETAYAQPAIYVVNALHWAAAQEDLPAADFFAGHSLGEYSALYAAGAFDFATGLALVRSRAELMSRISGGAMAAIVGVSEQIVEETLERHGANGVVIANHNAPEQFVLAGSREELARLRPVFEKMEGVRGFVPVRVSGPFHAPAMAPAAERFRSVLAAVDVGRLRTPVVSNVTGRPFGPDAREVRDLLAEQIARPVRWSDSIRYLRDAGVSDFTELGESKVLTSLIDRITTAREAAPDPRRDLIERIRREILQPEIGDEALGFDEDASFRQLGLNSIIYVRLARRAGKVFDVAVKPDVIFQHRSCAALADYLLTRDDVARTAVPQAPPAAPDAPPAPLGEYRDERVAALLHDCANGTLSVDRTVEAIRALA